MKFHEYTNEKFQCPYCEWSGLGSELSQGDVWAAGFEIHCPKCHERLPGLIEFPVIKPKENRTENDKLAED